MTALDVYGPAIDIGQVTQAWRDLALRWINDYLARIELANQEEYGRWARPADWRVDSDRRVEVEDSQALLICFSNGELEMPTDDGDGLITSRMDVNIGVTCRDRDRQQSYLMACRYAWALAALVDQKGGEIGDLCQVASRPRQFLPDEARDPEMYVAYVSFIAQIDGSRSRSGGPEDPTPDGDTPTYPDTPTVLETSVVFQQS